ncbi:MAG TPA: phytanoyl-CoA dioxygenase family protein [Pyrinomonadaceae bacterium]|nr:phytanoyl-CoA dioxygenase family protein [Pyrinomonadaceae bacterium]
MVIDLSEQHGPITTLFDRLSARDKNRYRLSPEQIDFFHTNAYLAGISLLNEVQIEALREELARLVDPHYPGHDFFYEFHSNESSDPSTVLFHALGAWRIAPAFHDLLWHPRFLMPASQLLGGAVRFWHDQIFVKPPHHGSVVAWHQDYSYWTRTQPMAHLSCWIGLDDSRLDNGCVHYVPKSHRWNLLPITGLANDMNAIQSVLTDERKAQFKPVAIELKAGEGSFHHPLMVHGSYENRSEQPRRGAVINVFRDGVLSASDAPLLQSVPPIRSGEKIQGQFFPLLFDPSSPNKLF